MKREYKPAVNVAGILVLLEIHKMEKDVKIRFIEPRSPNANVFSKEMFLPLLGHVYLGTILKKKGYDVKIYNENISKIYKNNELISDVLDADILMLSCLTSTAPRGYKIASDFKSSNPKKRAIMGGIHASFMYKESLKHVDSVVVGEAEPIIEQVINNNKNIFHGFPCFDLDSLPYPDFSLIKGLHSMKITPVLTSRGCPYNCNFCSVTAMFGRKYRFRSTENVINELRNIKSKRIFFYDDHFTANRERTSELLEEIKEERLKSRWAAQVRVNIANDEKLLKLMSETNCERVYIGFESINPKTLKLYNKGQQVKEIKNSVKALHEYGIDVHGMFVIGSDYDDKKSPSNTIDFCNDNSIDTVQLMILTPLPGSNTYNVFDSQNRIFTKNWKYYDGQHVVFKPMLMSPLELQTGVIDAMKSFYSKYEGIKLATRDLFKYSVSSLRNWIKLKKTRFPAFRNYAFKFVGSSIIRRWKNQNRDYFSFLAKFSKSHHSGLVSSSHY